jgi:hypothetical protein
MGAGSFGGKPMIQKAKLECSRAGDRLKSEALAILSYLRAGHAIPSGVLERQLRKLGGVREIVMNPLSHTVKIRYDPRVVSAEKIRSVLKKLGKQY